MRNRVLLAAVCALGFFAGGVRAQSLPPNPRLLVDAKDLAALRERIAAEPWAGQWKRLREQVDASLQETVELPPRGGNWSHNYVCPEHGSRLRRGKQVGPWQWEHTCPVGPHTLLGNTSKATLDFDGNGIAAVHGDFAEATVNCGLLYQITGDAKYAHRAKEILLAYADRYLSYPLHDNQGRPGSGARVASQSLTEASWLIGMTQGADLVWKTLSDAEKKAIETKLLRPALDQVIIPKTYGIHNIQCRQNAAIGLVGFLLNDRKLVALAIDDPKLGFRQQIAKGVLDDGMWTEGASGYHFFTIDGLWPLSEAARHCGIDLYSERYKRMFDAPVAMAMPDQRLPNFNDTGIVDLSRQADQYELAYARWKDAKYLPLLEKSDRTGRLALLYGVRELPTNVLSGDAAAASRNMEASGYAILEKGAGDQATWFCLKYGPHGGAHGHPDKNTFILYSAGRILFADAGTHAYGSPLHNTWDKETVAHNTIVVDEKSQTPTTGKCLAFGSTPDGIDYAVTDAGDIYPDSKVRFVRTAAMVSPTLILIIDQVSAGDGRDHTFDAAFHMPGKWDGLPDGDRWPAPATKGYQHLDDATSRLSTDTLSVQSTLGKSATRLTLAGGKATELITGMGVGESTANRVPMAVFRRKGQATTFAWAISLDGKPVKLELSDDAEAPKLTATLAERGGVEISVNKSGTPKFSR